MSRVSDEWLDEKVAFLRGIGSEKAPLFAALMELKERRQADIPGVPQETNVASVVAQHGGQLDALEKRISALEELINRRRDDVEEGER